MGKHTHESKPQHKSTSHSQHVEANANGSGYSGGIDASTNAENSGSTFGTTKSLSASTVSASTGGTTETVDMEFEAPEQKRNVRKALVALAVIIAMLLVFIVAGSAWLDSKLSQVQTLSNPFKSVENIAPRPEHLKDDNQPVNFLILGSDSRISAGNPNEWKAGAQRTDAFMVLQIAGDRQSINVISVPRDSWVPIPGYGDAKINAAFSYGGPSLTIATVEQLTNIRIDHVAVVDFTSFKELTDTVGGVELTSENEGTKLYDGEEALAFVRERKSLPGGDFDRVRRQQAWMSAVLKKTLTKENLTSPSKLMSIYNSVSPYIAMDDQLGLTELIELATQMPNLRPDDINFVVAPYLGTGTSNDGQSIVLLDEPKFKEMSQAFAEDKALGYINANSSELRTLENAPVR